MLGQQWRKRNPWYLHPSPLSQRQCLFWWRTEVFVCGSCRTGPIEKYHFPIVRVVGKREMTVSYATLGNHWGTYLHAVKRGHIMHRDGIYKGWSVSRYSWLDEGDNANLLFWDSAIRVEGQTELEWAVYEERTSIQEASEHSRYHHLQRV